MPKATPHQDDPAPAAARPPKRGPQRHYFTRATVREVIRHGRTDPSRRRTV